jgi:hypothetical protein
MHYIVLGGQQRPGAAQRQQGTRFQKAVIAAVDAAQGRSQVIYEFGSPTWLPDSYEEASILFKAGTVKDGRLYACTSTRVLVFSLPDMEVVSHISLPRFNDLHHVWPTERGTLLVVVTGLDMVVELDLDGNVLREWNVLGEDPWARFSRDTDYRQVVSTKPHHAHPNHVIEHGDEIWVTRFEQRDAICLTDPGKRIDIGVQRPHDGEIHGERIYFTTVDGHVVVGNLATCEREAVYDLNTITGLDCSLGWCRGIHVVDEETVVIGFSRLRPTKLRENVRWVRAKFGGAKTTMPSRLAQYNLRHGRVDWQCDLEGAGVNVMFSVHGAEAFGAFARLPAARSA